MIERAAKAAHAALQANGNIQWDWDDPSYVNVRRDYLLAARAMITAMREPTIWMIAACGNLPGSQQEYWKRSIDAALTEPTPES